jgi:hypothetical protein
MREAPTPPDLLRKVLEAAGPDLILVGGQALAFWMNHFGVELPSRFAFVSADVDFLAKSAGDKREVIRLAKLLGGEVVLPHAGARTALVGRAIKPLSGEGGRYYNIDVVFKIYGANEALVREAALEVQDRNMLFRVMHPMDVLKSRLDNLYGLAEKRQPDRLELSQMQLRVAIQVAQRFQLDVAAKQPVDERGRSSTLPLVKFIGLLAESDAGRKVAERHDIHVADAVEPSTVASPTFHSRRLPQLLKLMSQQRREALQR